VIITLTPGFEQSIKNMIWKEKENEGKRVLQNKLLEKFVTPTFCEELS
jgi:hypothetical protein